MSPRPLATRLLLLWPLLAAPLGCSEGAPATCSAAYTGEVDGVDAVRAALTAVRARAFDDIAAAPVRVVSQPRSDGAFLVANFDFETLEAPPLERDYIIAVNPAMFEDPPPPAALSAILTHEMAHIRDYTGMDAEALAAFGLWYALGDVAAYERRTDEQALDHGCAEGLIQYREWLYHRLEADPELVAQKRAEYYTPEEIRAYQPSATPGDGT